MLAEGLLQQLNPLHYVVRQTVMGRVGGSHVSRRKGLSLDFAEHRDYQPGDDYRYIDWNLYGRLDRLFVKVFAREEDFPVYLLLDLSRSMGVGSKLSCAQKLAAALGYIALKDQNRLGVYPFDQGLDLDQAWQPRSGWKQTLALFEYLQSLKLHQDTDLNCSLSQFAHLSLNRGLVLVFSDMFSENGYEQGLIELRSAGFTVMVFQVLAAQDIDPRLAREVWLTPAERGSQHRRLGGPEAVAMYLRAVTQYADRLQEFCQHHEIGYLRLPTSLSLEETIQRLRGAVLR